MENVININDYMPASDEEIKKMIDEHRKEFNAVFGSSPKDGEPGIVTVMRKMHDLDMGLVAQDIVHKNLGNNRSETSEFEARRAERERLQFSDLIRQYMYEEEKADEEYEKLIGISPTEHNELLEENWRRDLQIN